MKGQPMNVEKTILYEDDRYKIMRRQNMRGKFRHSVKLELFAIDKTTGKPVELLSLPGEILDLVSQEETLS